MTGKTIRNLISGKENGMAKKVLVGMSGGVDSAVAAVLLLRQGYDVTGVTLKLWDGEAESGCCSLTDTEDARSVAQRLDIPFYVLNFKDMFKETVVEPFIRSYLAGETPNPCLACNDSIKFSGMLAKARALGMDFIATGHYARLMTDPTSGRILLMKGIDPRKDQSYVLCNLTQEQLAATLFPLGGMEKPDVRKLAEEMGFVVSQKPDSQDICFVGDGHYADFIRGYTGMDSRPGAFVDSSGKVLGTHKGLIHYTIGQRKHLGASFGKRMAVLAKSAEDNTITVGEEPETRSSEVWVRQVNWMKWEVAPASFHAGVRTRYHGEEAQAMVETFENGLAHVRFDVPHRALTPGQAAVFYEGDVVLGGGMIAGGITANPAGKHSCE